MLRPLFVLIGSLLLVLATGCSSFDQRWSQMPAMNAASAALPLAGKWDGSWQSAGGHSGALRAIIDTNEAPSSATGAGSQHYAATFKSTYQVILSGTYTVDLVATRRPDAYGVLTDPTRTGGGPR